MRENHDFLNFAISVSESILPNDWLKLLQIFKNPSEILKQDQLALDAILKSPKKVSKLLKLKKQLPELEKKFLKLKDHQIKILSYTHKNYPITLKNISSPPACLFYKGEVSLLNHSQMIAVVGTRKMTTYGKKVIDKIINELCEAGLVVVSGLAFGVDAYAHQISLNYPKQSVAVLAKGVDQASPRWHHKLFQNIIEKGCVVSEFPFAEEIRAYHFPRRNRIVSGLCKGVLVVEAPEKSGALITAYAALQQNRNVYAIPGGIDQPMSQGCLQLIKEGAKLVSKSDDILEDFECDALPLFSKKELPVLNEIEQKIYDFCLTESKSQFEIYDKLSDSSSEVSAALTKLELMGVVSKNEAGKFICQV